VIKRRFFNCYPLGSVNTEKGDVRYVHFYHDKRCSNLNH
jgi:hypothetical protein